MYSSASPNLIYRNPQFLQLAFLQLYHQQQRGVFCDVLLKAEGEVVPAHGCILSACSPFFTELLEWERPAQGCKVVLELEGLKIRTLRKLVDFLYTSEIEVYQEEVQDVLSAARQLRVYELESLQLEGGKLVKAPQGQRLNQECLKPPIAAPISARVVPSSHCPQTLLPVTQTLCPLGAVRLKLLGKDEGPQDKSSGHNAENLSGTLLLKRKAKRKLYCSRRRPQKENFSPPSHSQESKENKSDLALGSIELSSPSLYPSVGNRLLPIKIRLSRSKPSPNVCTSTPLSILNGNSSVPADHGWRLWQQENINKMPEDEHKSGRASPLQSTPSPSCLRKTGGSKEWSPEVRASNSDSANKGKIGRMKLRRTVSGTHWEVVQEPPFKTSQDSSHVPEPRDSKEPPGNQPSSVYQQEMLSTRKDKCEDSSVCYGLQDILLSGSLSSDHPVVKSKFGSSPEVVRKEPAFGINCREPYAFDKALSGQTCETEEYRNTNIAATSELEFKPCGSEIELPIGSLESPRAKDCRTPSYHLTETGKNWIKEEEECYLPEIEFRSRECIGLEKEPVGENKEPVEPFTPLKINGQVLSVGCSLTQDQDIISTQPANGQRDKILHNGFLGLPQISNGDLSPPCSNSMETRLEVSVTTEEVLYPDPEPGKEVFSNCELLDPLPASLDEEEIDVVNWTLEGRLVSTCIPSVWPDPSSESETEVDILT
ncbi:unnamed protein product [Pipistrellus nathusii]|uniref:BTB domain-containing protein n=1 Tax=Pipistrellus nathusii TaxID=59473 RepID=A0ABN9Z7M6_PIPNA